MMGGLPTDIGSGLGRLLRGSLDIAGKALKIVTTRGGADEVVTISEDDSAPSVDPMIWYALGAGGILIVAAIAVKKRKKGK